ncbi:tyrosine-type recombinase/integrase [Metallosphaera sp.]|uniref:tyrosine-type recombinase/integrase n=1 Tax=Metallosphaera sp. TaxID=2020860 RepID=UPI0031775C87
MLEEKATFRWDKGVNFEKMRKTLERDYKQYGQDTETFDKEIYVAILLTQLVNGTRISEAVRAFYQFVETGGKERNIVLKAEKGGNERQIIIPKLIAYKKYYSIVLTKSERKMASVLKMFCRRHYGVNTHSFRYAFITKAIKDGLPAEVVAKITGHRSLRHILTYVQTKEAEDYLTRVVNS